MVELIFVVFVLLAVSFTCSLLEAVLLSIRRPYIQVLEEKKSRAAPRLLGFKEKIEEPISAILTLNTVSNTVGAAISGAIALRHFGSTGMAIFSGILTLLVLLLAEIIPKTIGAVYWRSLAPVSAYLLTAMTYITKPVYIPVQLITRMISSSGPKENISKREILSYIQTGYFQGVLQSSEFRIVENVFQLDSIKVKDIMTPRTVVYWIPSDQTTEDLVGKQTPLQFSRIPLYNVHEDIVEGVVLRRNIMNHLAGNGPNVSIRTLARKPEFVFEKTSVYKVLNLFIKHKLHLAIVLSEYGDFVGIVTMEDTIETLLGQEIVDEFDPVVDMRQLAMKRSGQLLKKEEP